VVGRGRDWSNTLSAPDRLYFTDSDEANKLIAQDPMALLIGFALDQHWSVQFCNRNRFGRDP